MSVKKYERKVRRDSGFQYMILQSGHISLIMAARSPFINSLPLSLWRFVVSQSKRRFQRVLWAPLQQIYMLADEGLQTRYDYHDTLREMHTVY